LRRHGVAVKGIAKDIWQLNSHPTEAIHLEPASPDVGVKCPPIIALDLYLDAGLL
jgi:hypothetical protein